MSTHEAQDSSRENNSLIHVSSISFYNSFFYLLLFESDNSYSYHFQAAI